MGPSALGASGTLARPWRPLLVLPVLLLAAGLGARAQATIDNNFGELYGVGPATENCLNEAGSDCSGSTGPQLNSCLCRRDRFALESARCIARVSPGDLDDVYFQMRANCLETGGFTLVVDEAEWASAAEAATATTFFTPSPTSEPSTSTPPRTTATPPVTLADGDDDTATTAAPTASTGLDSMAAASTATAAAAAGLDTGGKIGVGVAVAVSVILLTAGVVIWLKWRKRQREGPRYADRNAHVMESSDMVRTYPPSPAGPGGGAVAGAGTHPKPPVGAASTSAFPAGRPSPDLGGGGGSRGGHWMPAAHPWHPHQRPYTYADHPPVAELGDGSDVTSHALSARDSARYSELPGAHSPLYPPPSSPSPVSPGPNPSPPLPRPHDGQGSRGGGPKPGAQV